LGIVFFWALWIFFSNKETPVVIGSDVMFGPYCKVIGGNHDIDWANGTMMRSPHLGAGKGIVIEYDIKICRFSACPL
jgi:hypothetical protein